MHDYARSLSHAGPPRRGVHLTPATPGRERVELRGADHAVVLAGTIDSRRVSHALVEALGLVLSLLDPPRGRRVRRLK